MLEVGSEAHAASSSRLRFQGTSCAPPSAPTQCGPHCYLEAASALRAHLILSADEAAADLSLDKEARNASQTLESWIPESGQHISGSKLLRQASRAPLAPGASCVSPRQIEDDREPVKVHETRVRKESRRRVVATLAHETEGHAV